MLEGDEGDGKAVMLEEEELAVMLEGDGGGGGGGGGGWREGEVVGEGEEGEKLEEGSTLAGDELGRELR